MNGMAGNVFVGRAINVIIDSLEVSRACESVYVAGIAGFASIAGLVVRLNMRVFIPGCTSTSSMTFVAMDFYKVG